MKGRAASFIYFPAILQALYCFITTHFFKVWIGKKKKKKATCSEPATGLLTGHGEGPENLACLLPALGQVPQGLSSSSGPFLAHSFSLYLWGSQFGSREAGIWRKIPGPDTMAGFVQSIEQGPDAKESKIANAWLSSHIHWPCPSVSHWKKFTSTYFSYKSQSVYMNKCRACVHRAWQLFLVQKFNI